MCSVEWPAPVRRFILTKYSAMFGCKLEEMEAESLEEFKSLQQFFTRKLKKECRPISRAPVVRCVAAAVFLAV